MSDEEVLAAELAAEATTVAAQAAPPEAPTLERMQQLAAEILDIDNRIEKNTARIEELMERRNTIVMGDLVEMMDATRITKLEVDGHTFKAGPYYKAVIPSENPTPGLDWLEAHDAGDLVKNAVVAAFPRESAAEAIAAAQLLRERYQMATVTRERSVHWMTLTAWLKEAHQSGDPERMPPLDLIGGKIGRVVRVTKPKGKV